MDRLKEIWPLLGALAVSGIIVVLTIISGAYFYLAPSLPSAEILRDIELQTPLRIFSRDGRLMAQIGEKRRIPASYEEIPDIIINAFLAAEDDRFFEHPGYDYQGIARAVINLVRTGTRSQGGSTITQQLARNYFLDRERSFVRKAKELILAVQIENEFSKQEILKLYLNKIFLGQRAYGVGAAAEVYFGKSLQQLNIAEAATIAALPKAPSSVNPVKNIQAASIRRAYVLRRMLELEFITQDQHDEALALPMESRLHGPKVELHAPYVTEMVRAEMVGKYGLGAYTRGYKVVTTINAELQESANRSLHTALFEYDRRHGYRGPVARNVLDPLLIAPGQDAGLEVEKSLPDGEQHAAVGLDDTRLTELLHDLSQPKPKGLHNAIVLSTDDNNSALLYIEDAGRVRVAWDSMKWRPHIDDDTIGNTPQSINDVVTIGDLVRLRPTADKGWQLTQMPRVQGAFVALDPSDGATIALVGGFDFSVSKFNRAVQSKRQPGSSFKPFIYSAALENGFTTATLVNDAPVVFDDSGLEDTWRPENYSRKFHGPIRLREALIKSLNLVSVRILRSTGLGPAIQHIKKFGIPASALPRNLSLALGSGGTSPQDVAAGYAAFASGGFRTTPYLIERVYDADNKIIFHEEVAFVCHNCGSTIGLPEVRRFAPTEVMEEPSTTADDGSIVNSSLITEPALVSEIPPYPNLAAMTDHGLTWRATAANAPLFSALAGNLPERAITAENAYLIYSMMQDVIQRGTGKRARTIGRKDLAGKTGTSNERRDAWFSGFNGDIVATAWVGFDDPLRTLGEGETGAKTALPIWKYFMQDTLAGTRDATIPRPAGIITARIVPESGLVAPAGYSGARFELFREGHVPERQSGDTDSPINFSSERSNDDNDEDIF
ncbi:MAG: penicillin-binding protein 1A [Gammaproteobacteria bacterium]|jgi:penicillin-binding protein 1A|nr:penicillin-binding protein 1A [Gammaproteobacteria bacterium]MDP7154562.1 penicillin-binding protein 1A [Gammaproteobacteria bacterium]MDP7419765.1 penicillin-binding protein 1A [Gammaproteobacteria bacterium]MDP7660374.1 penicillin-binding protein 1A [Gammaproteobacteria bacterium]HJP37635.1 penicillin-binding protein 1A [Gammaproteobacteria bacterium]